MAVTIASLIITGAICSAILWIMMWHFRRQRLYKLASKFRGPPPLPFIGNAHLFLGGSEYFLNRIRELAKSYSLPIRLWLGPILIIYVSDPEQIETICLNRRTLGKGHVFMDYIGPLLGTGLLSAPVPKWKVHRKLIQPTFNSKILDSFVETFATRSKILTEVMEQNLDGSEFEIFNLVASCTLDMICETAIGVDAGAQANKNPCYVGAVQKFLPENVAKRHPCAFMVFSAGPRNCIGLNYAMMSMKTVFATVLRRYILKKDDILPVKDIRLKMEIVLKPVNPIKIRIERRTGI